MLARCCGRREEGILLVVGEIAGMRGCGIGVAVDAESGVASAAAELHVHCVRGPSCESPWVHGVVV